jgi:hypothetical protein
VSYFTHSREFFEAIFYRDISRIDVKRLSDPRWQMRDVALCDQLRKQSLPRGCQPALAVLLNDVAPNKLKPARFTILKSIFFPFPSQG